MDKQEKIVCDLFLKGTPRCEIAKIIKKNNCFVTNILKKNKPKKKCLKCFKKFTPKKSDSNFCSNKCMWTSEYMKSQRGRREQKRRKRIIEKLGGRCVVCGITDWKVLQFNHLRGGGEKDRQAKGGKRKVEQEILDDKREGDFDLRCANCNILYNYELGIWREY